MNIDFTNNFDSFLFAFDEIPALKYVYCDMRIFVEKNSALLCFLDGFGISVQVVSY